MKLIAPGHAVDARGTSIARRKGAQAAEFNVIVLLPGQFVCPAMILLMDARAHVLLLDPLDFNALYQQQTAQAQAMAETQPAGNA